MTVEGACPTCGAPVDAPSELDAAARQRVPWHFWVFLAAAAVYLGWRAIDGIALLF
ncbi:MAG: hypothetical protein OXT07_05715 [bacterium]|nr:hypothetical protein [bacterium]